MEKLEVNKKIVYIYVNRYFYYHYHHYYYINDKNIKKRIMK